MFKKSIHRRCSNASFCFVERKDTMTELFITWKFKNKNWIEYSFCKDEKELYSLMKRRYGVDKEKIEIIKIEISYND